MWGRMSPAARAITVGVAILVVILLVYGFTAWQAPRAVYPSQPAGQGAPAGPTAPTGNQ